MNTELTNNGLQPPDKSGSEYEETERLIKLLEWVKETYKPEQIFDLYNHDREVAKNFNDWYEKSGWMPASNLWGKYSLHEGYINIDPKAPNKVNFEQLWEIYCTEIKNK